ncbi:MAG: hypothetical protein ACR2PA_21255 [Hyphomicrobiaceae bacterium]
MKLNGFEVDERLAALMRRPDWAGRRTDPVWLERFPSHPNCTDHISFVDLIGPERAICENESLRDQALDLPDPKQPPIAVTENLNSKSGYIIGFTDHADAVIFVDVGSLRHARIIYDDLNPTQLTYATAFATLPEFIEFYLEQHDA